METLKLILGQTSLAMFGALIFFAFVGVAISLLLHSRTRDKKSKNTPEKFSVWFLFFDNLKRIILNLLLILVTIRFAGQIIELDTTDSEKYYLISLFIGFGYDKLAQFWKSKSSLLKMR